jgi:hypothetical protein
MPDNRCPSCENDLTSEVSRAVIRSLASGEKGPASINCPHCGAELSLAIQVNTRLALEQNSAV